MNKIIAKGKSIQDGIPTPDEPKNITNLLEVNGIQYIDNIPNNMFIAITKEQFCEYQQLKEQNKKLIDFLNSLNEQVKFSLLRMCQDDNTLEAQIFNAKEDGKYEMALQMLKYMDLIMPEIKGTDK